MRGNYIIGILLFIFSSTVHTSKGQTEKREGFFRIVALKKIKSDSIHALIYYGKKHGLENGLTGSVKGVFKSGDDRSDFELGFATIIVINDSNALVSIRPKDTTGKKPNDIRKGDFVKIQFKAPKLPYRSIYFSLSLLDIEFLNAYKNPMYNFYHLLTSDSKNLEDSLIQACVNDVKDTYDTFKDDTSEAFQSLRVPISEGRYKGRTALDVMGNCSSRDIFSFLNFVIGYPGKYIGNSWKINETFATWVINKGPYSKNEILDSVLAYQHNKILLEKFIIKNRTLIIKDEYIRDWVSNAWDFYDRKDFEKSNLYLYAAKITLPILNDPASSGLYYYIKSHLAQTESKYEKAISYADTAILYYDKTNNYEYKAETKLKKAYCLRMLKKYEESINLYLNVLAFIKSNEQQMGNSVMNSLYKKTYSFLGYVNNDKGDFLKALDYLQQSLPYYKIINTYESRTDINNVQKLMATIYKTQGEYKKATVIYEDQLQNAQYIDDKNTISDVRDNLGYIQFKLGNYRNSIDYHRSALSLHLVLKNYSDAGYSLSQIGQAFWNLGNYDSAIQSHQLALNYRNKVNNYSGLAFSWKKLGSLFTLVGKKNEALNSYDSVAHFYSLAKDSSNLIDNYLDVGEVYNKDKQYQKANEYYLKAYQLNLNQKNKSKILRSLMKLASNAYTFDTALARVYYTKSFNLANEIGSKTDALYANLNLGLLAFRSYDYDLGLQHFNTALIYCLQENNKSDEAYTYNKLGNAYRWKLEFKTSLNYYQKALHIYDSLGEKSSIPEILGNIAHAKYGMGQFAEAVASFKKAIELAKDNNSLADAGYSLNSLSFIYLMNGNMTASQSAADSALAIFKNLQNNWQMADSYITLGNIFNQKQEYQKAVESYQTSDSLYSLEKDNVSRSTSQNNIGNVYFYQSDYDAALQYFFESEKLLAPIKTISESHALAKLNIGETYFHKKDYKTAEKYLNEGYKMAIDKKMIRYTASGNLLLGKLLYESKKYPEAEQKLLLSSKQYLEYKEITGYIESQLYLGKLNHSLNKNNEALNYFQEAIYNSTQTGVEKYLWEALYEKGLLYYNLQNFDSSCYYLKEAASATEKVAENLYGGSNAKKIFNEDYRRVDIYNKLVAGYVKLNRTNDALFYADRGNAQGVKEQLSIAGISGTDVEKNKAIAKSKELLQKQNAIELALGKEKSKPEKEQNKQLIASLESVKEVTQKDYTNYINDLVKKHEDLQSYFSSTNPIDFKNYIDFIPDSTMVVLYVINDQQLLIFTVTQQKTSIKTVTLNDDLNAKSTKFLALLNNPKIASGTKPINVRSAKLLNQKTTEGDFRKEASDLYDLLITPIQDDLKNIKNVCIIPNGKLSNIPFQSLGTYNDQKEFGFLIENYNIFYTNKMDVFVKPYKNSPIQNSFVAFGNPDKSLPKATVEVKNLSNIIKNATLYLEDQATEDKAKNSLENFKYIHFATHGILDYTNIQKSFLLFKKSETEDGHLSIEEINGLSISGCDLVTLSACETAVSQETSKGWYISPANSFLANRVKSVIASLWPVDDDATSILMTTFYQNIQTMPKALALRKAQETLSKTPGYSHPYFWSAFVLYGDWR